VPTVRCFVALPVPDPVREALAAIRQAAPPRSPVRWVAPQSIHLTLKFLGQIEPPVLDSVRGALSSFPWNLAPFAFTLSGVGAFPGTGRPRVLWVGVTDGAERVVALAEKVEQALGPLGLPREERAFSPHLTIGRVNGAGPAGWAQAFATRARFDPVEVPATALTLYESKLLPTGARYAPLLTVGFGA
jgi:2'-5' RNA ligase